MSLERINFIFCLINTTKLFLFHFFAGCWLKNVAIAPHHHPQKRTYFARLRGSQAHQPLIHMPMEMGTFSYSALSGYVTDRSLNKHNTLHAKYSQHG